MKIKDIQHARAIISTVGSRAEIAVVDALRSATCLAEEYSGHEAEKIVDEITDSYTLKTANELWDKKFNELPDWIKNW